MMAKGAQVTEGLPAETRRQIGDELRRRKLGTDDARAAFVEAVDEACAVHQLEHGADRDLERDKLHRLQKAADEFARQAKAVGNDADLSELVRQMLLVSRRDPHALDQARDAASDVGAAAARLGAKDYRREGGRPKGGAGDQLVADVVTAWREYLGEPSAAREGHLANVLRLIAPETEIGESRLRRLLK